MSTSRGRRLCAMGLFLVFLFEIFSNFSFASAVSPVNDTLSAHSAVLLEPETGTVILAKNADERLPMASTTKIMTALIAIESVPLDKIVTVPDEAAGIEGSSVYLFAGEQLTMESLLYALMLASANDAAVTIAVEVAGSVERFVDLMNQRAADIGLVDTHFENPNGLPAERHYTTARELALLTAEAMRNPVFRTIVSTWRKTIPAETSGGVRLLLNHNKLLKSYEGCIGVKTGFTKQSGRCLVSAAERDGVSLIAVTLNAPDDWNDHHMMLDTGFTLYQSVPLGTELTSGISIPVINGSVSNITAYPSGSVSATLPREHGQIRLRLELPRFLYGKITTEKPIGQAVYLCDRDRDGKEEVIAQVPFFAEQNSDEVTYTHPLIRILRTIRSFFRRVFGITYQEVAKWKR